MSGQFAVAKFHPPGYAGQLVGTVHRTKSYINDLGSGFPFVEFFLGSFGFGPNELYEWRSEGFLISYFAPPGDTQLNASTQMVNIYNSIPELNDVGVANLVGVSGSGASIAVKSLIKGVNPDVTFITFNFTGLPGPTLNTPIEIPFGRAVVRRTSDSSADVVRDGSASLPSSAGDEFLGIVSRVHSDVDPLTPLGSVAPFKKMSVVNRGLILVQTEESVLAGDDVYFRHTPKTGFTDLGVFRNDADTARAAQITGAKFETSTTGAGIAIISLRGA